MAKLVPLSQSGIDALAQWIKSQLPSEYKVHRRWPSAAVPLTNCVTVITAGKATEQNLDPQLQGPGTPVDDNLTEYTWRVRAVRQPIQIDCWATDPPTMGDMEARMDAARSCGTGLTLNDGGDIASDHLTLAIGVSGGPVGYADYFIEGPNHPQTEGQYMGVGEDAAQQKEYRVTFDGFFDAMETVTATVGRMKELILKTNAALGDVPAPTDVVTTLTAAGTTTTREPHE